MSLRDVARGEERLAQPLVGIAPVIGGRAVEPDVVELDLADVEDVELLDHGLSPGLVPERPCGRINKFKARGAAAPATPRQYRR